MTILCPTNTTPCVDRESSLLEGRFGFGEATAGGAGKPKVVITSLTDGSFLSAITQGNAWVCFDPSLSGQTWHAPQIPVGQPGSGQIVFGPNLTIDGRDADVTLQLGTPNLINKWPWTTDDWVYKPIQLAAKQGNLIMSCLTIQGDMQQGLVEGTGNFNGTTDFEVQDGSNYWFDHLTIRRMSDEALSVFPLNGGIPDLITMSNVRFDENKNDSIIGNLNFPNTSPRVTQALNWSTGAVEGRAPGVNYNSRTHVFNVVAENYNRQGLQAFQGAEIISECNVLDPGCRTNANTTRFAGNGGKLNDSGSFVYTSESNGTVCNLSTDTNFSEPLSNMFLIPYAYTKKAGTTEQGIRDYVAANSGAHAQSKRLVFCGE